MSQDTPALERWARKSALAVAAAALCLAAACGGGDGETATPAPATPVSTSEAAGPLPGVVSEVLDEVAAIRELSPPAGLRAELISRPALPDILRGSLTDADREWFAETTTLYRLLGYIGADADYLDLYLSFAEQAVIGLYDPVMKTLWVVRDNPADDWDDLDRDGLSTLAHELIHALQDDAYDLTAGSAATEDDLDAYLSWTALVEGDAVTYERVYSGRSGRLPGGTVLFASVRASSQTVPAPLEREFRFPYEAGAEWVTRVRANGGVAAVDALYDDAPRWTASILHPELAAGWAPETVVLPDFATGLGEGWMRESGGTFGEFHLRNLLLTRLGAVDAATAAAGWDGDRYDVYVNGQGEAVVVLRVRMATQDDAAELAEGASTFLEGVGACGQRLTATELASGRGFACGTLTGGDVFVAFASHGQLVREVGAIVAAG